MFMLPPRSSSLPPNKGLLMDFSSHSSINLTISSTSISINILEINLARTRATSHQLQNSIVNFNSDIILMQEPYSRAEKIQGFPQSWTVFPSKTNEAAISIVNKNLKPAIIASKKYAVAVKLQTGQNPTTFISAYNSPHSNIQETLQELQDIIMSLRANNLFIASRPDAPPTFERGILKGWPYLTISIQGIISKIAKWEVSEEPFLSNHKYINIKIESQIKTITYNKFKTLHGNHRKFLNELKPSINPLLEEIINSQIQDDINKPTSHLISKIKSDMPARAPTKPKSKKLPGPLPGAHPN
ncbi:hypothetical protein AVEN_209462-1 [Araneus ventricosus]|uniref:Endonuclease/exonuclease/phosphatase domain-containing protein n=1 Tax=Araneus ventricosus TaxID=182803 RepID=A0A4Y2UX37_ARAVE|nr:hypothetical protein AVEN_209462-1 [Araneus ventricosus]